LQITLFYHTLQNENITVASVGSMAFCHVLHLPLAGIYPIYITIVIFVSLNHFNGLLIQFIVEPRFSLNKKLLSIMLNLYRTVCCCYMHPVLMLFDYGIPVVNIS